MSTVPAPSRIPAWAVGASRALSAGRPLDALAHLGARREAHALALRGIALAQLGELTRARASLVAALRRFRRARATLWMAKAAAAIAEIDLARRDLSSAARALDPRPLRSLGDAASASYLEVLRTRLLAMLGRRAEAETLLASVPWGSAALLARAELLARRGRFAEAAQVAATVPADNPLLHGEAMRLRGELVAPRFRLRRGGAEEPISLVDVGRLREPFLDLLRRRFGGVSLARSPASIELLASLSRGPVTARRLYGATNEALEARLKMEVSRLRARTGLAVQATRRGYEAPPIAVLLPGGNPIEALLSDGEAWAPGAIATVLGLTARSVERALEASSRFRAIGRGRARRYALARQGTGIATQLLLLAVPSEG